MKRIRIIGLSLVAVFAMSALVAASASAESLPRYANCEKVAPIAKKYHGEYANSTCGPPKTEKEKAEAGKDEGKYELTPWREGETSKVKTTSTKSVLDFANEKGEIVRKVECAKDKGTGEITGEETDSEVIEYEKCITPEKVGAKTIKVLCGNAINATTGKLENIKTEPLESNLDLLPGGKAGILISPSGNDSAIFNCGVVYFEVRGVAVGEVKPENSCSKTITSTFAVNGKGEEQPEIGFSLKAFVYNETTGKEEEFIHGGLQSTEKQTGETFCVWTETEVAREEKLEKEDGI